MSSLPAHAALLSHLPTSLQMNINSMTSKILSSASDGVWKAAAVSLGLGYLVLVQVLRFQREKGMRRRYGYPDRASLKAMTVEDAQKVLKELTTLEFPMMNETSLQFGLFKVSAFEPLGGHVKRNRTKVGLDIRRRDDQQASACYEKSHRSRSQLEEVRHSPPQSHPWTYTLLGTKTRPC
jgi:hypothetical protein